MEQATPGLGLRADARLRVLFYLPVVTPWWFEQICIRLITLLAESHEVHVMVPPLWSGTGIGAGQIPLLANLPEVFWHILDGPCHPVLRTDASGEEELVELVHLVAPDITLCRSADISTPARFPGAVRYITEGGAPPLINAPRSVWFAPTLFDHGILPDLAEAQLALLDALAEPLFDALALELPLPPRAEFMAMHGLPEGKRILGLPLDYEQRENFFTRHNAFPSNAEMIARLAAELDEDTLLAVSQHPLTERHGDPRSIDGAVAAAGGRVRVLSSLGRQGSTTQGLAQYSDAFVVGNSKSWSSAAFVGTPVVRLSGFATGEWVHAYRSVGAWLEDCRAGRVRRPDAVAARRWFAFHMLNNSIDTGDEWLHAEAIVARVLDPIDPARWPEMLERHQAFRAREMEKAQERKAAATAAATAE
ncbi:MAG: hypothetical protein V2I39_12105 [Erythrobacter sp.]|jgi:hypothetical protein|nr:hypothetical protein [Erythrobacter sp.]